MKPNILNCRLTLLASKAKSNLKFHIDVPIDVQEISNRLFIQGWVVHPTQKIEHVFLLSTDKKALGSTEPIFYRPRVHEIYGTFRNSKSTGFELTVSNLIAGEYTLIAETDSKDQITLAQVSLQGIIGTQKTVLFMPHIAKTAGSSVNKYLASHYAKDRYAVHVESMQEWRSDSNWARNLGFVAGHFNWPHFKRVLKPTGYYKITVVREPYAHLVSHIAWVRKLADEGEARRFAQHPIYVQHFARKLAKSDLSDSVEVGKLVASLEEKEMQLVDNCQTRYFTQIAVGERVCAEDGRSAIEASTEFDLVGTTDNIDNFLRTVAEYMEWKAPVSEVRENVTPKLLRTGCWGQEHSESIGATGPL